MIRFQCPVCSADIWFDSLHCEACRADLAFSPAVDTFVSLGPDNEQCCGHRFDVERCNWVAIDGDDWCTSCALDLDHSPHPLRVPFQHAKRRSIRQLLNLGVAVADLEPTLRFDMRPSNDATNVITGHADGVITLDTAEAEASVREEVRAEFGEPYRTPLGHVRHELGHWWWATAIDRGLPTPTFREVFGDERMDYSQALASHYASQDDGSWRNQFISFYAASHPWEDFAESFAHVLHIDDTFESAVSSNFAVPNSIRDFDELYPHWVSFTLALNGINRSMGMPDPYPFVASPPAVNKMAAIARQLARPNG